MKQGEDRWAGLGTLALYYRLSLRTLWRDRGRRAIALGILLPLGVILMGTLWLLLELSQVGGPERPVPTATSAASASG